MKKMKVFFSLVVFSLLLFASNQSAAGCGEQIVNTTNEMDNQVSLDFSYNCCAGDVIYVYNVESGDTSRRVLTSDGANADCD